MEPMAIKMLQESPELKENLNKIASDARFATNPNAILDGFIVKTQYYDKNYLLYPVGGQQ
jgi:hypothetical protein